MQTATLSLQPIGAEEVSAVLEDPRISAAISHDDRPAAFIDHPAARYLGAYVNGALAGFFLVIQSGFVEVDLHAAILRRFIAHSRALGRMCLAAVFAEPHVARATAYVIEGLDSAANYCLRLGFVREGFRRAALRKGGRLLGVHVLGITRAEWRAAA